MQTRSKDRKHQEVDSKIESYVNSLKSQADSMNEAEKLEYMKKLGSQQQNDVFNMLPVIIKSGKEELSEEIRSLHSIESEQSLFDRLGN